MPGEHDVLNDNGKQYRERFGRESQGDGWYSFDHKGVHFIGLVNVMNLKPGGLGYLGHDQLEWLEDNVADLSDSTPIVVFAHVPLWTVYPDWGWGTDDAGQALSYLKRFGSVTVLNGHIHQVQQKIEGQCQFSYRHVHRLSATTPGYRTIARPDESPRGQTPHCAGVDQRQLCPGREIAGRRRLDFGRCLDHRNQQMTMNVKIKKSLLQNPIYPVAADVSRLHFSWISNKFSADLRPLLQSCRSLKILFGLLATIVSLAWLPTNSLAGDAMTNSVQVTIDNFNFTPPTVTVSAGTKVTWVNKDDVPHTVTSDDKLFGSRALDTDDKFSFTFQTPGTYPYYCSVHPKMTGKVVVK